MRVENDMDKDQARKLLREYDLRVTAPRLAVFLILSEASRPLSLGDVMSRISEYDWDQATIYRNLIKLKEAGAATVVSQIAGIDRYALTTTHDRSPCHPHFFCEDCGRVLCLPSELLRNMSIEGEWSESLKTARLHFQGVCPNCTHQNCE